MSMPQPQDTNPYASPQFEEKPRPGEFQLANVELSVNGLLSYAWLNLSQHWGTYFGAGAIMLAMILILGAVVLAFQVSIGLVQFPPDPRNPPDLATNILSGWVSNGISLVTAAIVGVFAAGFCRMAFRGFTGRPPEIGDLFAGPGTPAGVVISILVQLSAAVPNMLGLLPATLMLQTGAPLPDVAMAYGVGALGGGIAGMVALFVASIYLGPGIAAAVDRDEEIGEAINHGAACTHQHLGAVVAGTLLFGLLGGLFMIVTCGIGYCLVVPFSYIFWVGLYLLASGKVQPATPPGYPPPGGYPQQGPYGQNPYGQ